MVRSGEAGYLSFSCKTTVFTVPRNRAEYRKGPQQSTKKPRKTNSANDAERLEKPTITRAGFPGHAYATIALRLMQFLWAP